MKTLGLKLRFAVVWLFAVELMGCPSGSTAEQEQHVDGGTHEPNDPDDPNDPDEPNEPSSAHLFMPIAEDGAANTRAPELVLDGNGDLHAVYPAYFGGDAYYAFCPDACSDPAEMRIVNLETNGTVLNASLAVTQGGAPRVLMSTGIDLYFAQCDAGCTDTSSWDNQIILQHDGDRAISDGALALDADDHPRFVMNTTIALLGIGQKAPETIYAQCDSGCTNSGSWTMDVIQEQIWAASQLRFDDAGRAHLATVAVSLGGGGPIGYQGAYLQCTSGCTTADDWNGIVLAVAYEDYAEELHPAISLALTKDAGARVAVLAETAAGGKQLAYFECDEDCANDHWRVASISEQDQLGSGVSIQLDEQDHPNIAFTLGNNIGVYQCKGTDCINEGAPWDLKEIELTTSLPVDEIIFWPNCTIAGWAFQDPSLVLDEGGAMYVGYQAEDLSGGATTTDPTKPACLAGADMVLTRLALMR